ncbi:MAG: cbb3-type cytochrome c oxidase N-terminal domain-containing protein [Bdellovibrionota bacterium]
MSEEKKDQVRPSTYDGIQEYDNQLPRWWLFTFFITIVFAFIYWSRYYVFESAPNQKSELANNLESVQKLHEKNEGPHQEEDLYAMAKDPAVLEKGSSVFKTNCIACHGQSGEGGIGPNLTDKYWLHGGKPENIEHTITNGVVEKGMTPWKGILSSTQIQQVAAYIMSLEGSNPANAKAPQGDLMK